MAWRPELHCLDCQAKNAHSLRGRGSSPAATPARKALASTKPWISVLRLSARVLKWVLTHEQSVPRAFLLSSSAACQGHCVFLNEYIYIYYIYMYICESVCVCFELFGWATPMRVLSVFLIGGPSHFLRISCWKYKWKYPVENLMCSQPIWLV